MFFSNFFSTRFLERFWLDLDAKGDPKFVKNPIFMICWCPRFLVWILPRLGVDSIESPRGATAASQLWLGLLRKAKGCMPNSKFLAFKFERQKTTGLESILQGISRPWSYPGATWASQNSPKSSPGPPKSGPEPSKTPFLKDIEFKKARRGARHSFLWPKLAT